MNINGDELFVKTLLATQAAVNVEHFMVTNVEEENCLWSYVLNPHHQESNV